jgi:hypothetical protein
VKSPPEPLPPNVQALIEAERLDPDAPVSVLERVSGRLEEQLVVGEDTVPSARGGQGLSQPAAGRRALASLARLGLRRLPYVAVGFGMGVAAAPSVRPLLSRLFSARPEHAVVAPMPPPAEAPEVAPTPIPPDTAPSIEAPPPPRTNQPTGRDLSRHAASGESIAAEMREVERVRALVHDGDAAQALELLAMEERHHPRSQLAEERELLKLQAYIRLGRLDEARQGLEAFRRNHPDSLLLPSVDAALRSLPQ